VPLPGLVPGPQKPQTVDEFAHYFFVGVIEEQRDGQHEIHDYSGRQQPAAPLGLAGVGEHLIDEIAGAPAWSAPPEADPVGQPVRTTASTTRVLVGHRC